MGVVVQGAELAAPLERRTHTLVVGSGAGGAVVAKILAEAGVEVVVVEEGGLFRARDFNQREDEMFAALYRAGGQQYSEDGTVSVLQGSCYGGSTVVNMGDCTATPPEVFEHWRRLLGLEEIHERSLEPSLARVRAALQVNRIGDGQVNANNRVVLDGAAALGLSAGVFEHNRVGCVGSGYCLLGCAYDAKKGAHLNYLPAALAAGAEAYTDLRVERLERLDGGRLRAHGDVVERGTRHARLPFRIEAERVVLAAGAVHSPAILARSGLARGLPELGRNLSLQPQMPVYAVFEDARPQRWRGIPQSAYCDAHDDQGAEHGLGGFRLEALNVGLANVAGSLPGFGAEHKRAMAAIERTATALLLVPDRPSGRIRWEWPGGRGVRPRIDYRAQPEWRSRLRRGLRHAAELYFAAGAAQVGFVHETFAPLRSPDELSRIDAFEIVPGLTRFISAHVQGSCRMSLDARTGVVDQDHRVHGLPNLYVVDASVMPTTAAHHTMLPIMALADRAAHRMLGA